MRDGAYLYVRRDGRALLVQRAGGVVVELMGVGDARERPARLTRRRIGDSIGEVVYRIEAERMRRYYEALLGISLDRGRRPGGDSS